jgi:beta-glucosidase
MSWISSSTAALIQQLYPSEQGGNALADVVFGDYNPSGKLSVGFPDPSITRSVGALPIYYDYLNSGRSITDSGHIIKANNTIVFGYRYVIGSSLPWYEFGYGKSYSAFGYSTVSLDCANVSSSDTITVSVDVTNTYPARDGTEVCPGLRRRRVCLCRGAESAAEGLLQKINGENLKRRFG